MCDFVYGTMPHAMVSLHWSVMLYQVTFELHSRRGSEISLVTRGRGFRLNIYDSSR